ncbi:MAG: hypothetical protein V8R46_01295 [Eubacterium ramulus]
MRILSRICEDYRDLEKELGIAPIPITLNEYSGGKFMDEEGNPGACAPLIAKFERLHINSALLSYWNNQGTPGESLTVAGKPNGTFGSISGMRICMDRWCRPFRKMRIIQGC